MMEAHWLFNKKSQPNPQTMNALEHQFRHVMLECDTDHCQDTTMRIANELWKILQTTKGETIIVCMVTTVGNVVRQLVIKQSSSREEIDAFILNNQNMCRRDSSGGLMFIFYEEDVNSANNKSSMALLHVRSFAFCFQDRSMHPIDTNDPLYDMMVSMTQPSHSIVYMS